MDVSGVEVDENVRTLAELKNVCAEIPEDELELVKLDQVGRRLSRLEEGSVDVACAETRVDEAAPDTVVELLMGVASAETTEVVEFPPLLNETELEVC